VSNNYRPHFKVLPEDDANRQMANGFVLEFPTRQIQILPVAGGWLRTVECFNSDHVGYMESLPNRFMILLIDFDGQETRLEEVRARIPAHLTQRVFILGAWTDPEALKGDLGPYETIGLKLAIDCREDTDTTWGHALLRHNAAELARLREQVRPILFPSV
jgi:hypothetical protein